MFYRDEHKVLSVTSEPSPRRSRHILSFKYSSVLHIQCISERLGDLSVCQMISSTEVLEGEVRVLAAKLRSLRKIILKPTKCLTTHRQSSHIVIFCTFIKAYKATGTDIICFVSFSRSLVHKKKFGFL